MDNFEKATIAKLRFNTTKGQLSVEDLRDLSVQSLDSMAKAVNKELKSEAEESFIPNKIARKSVSYNHLRLDILKHIILAKVSEQEAAATRTERRAKLENLKSLAANKANEAFAAQSLEEIQRQIAELESAD